MIFQKQDYFFENFLINFKKIITKDFIEAKLIKTLKISILKKINFN